MGSFEVYEAAQDSYLLERFVREHAFGRVLEIGTGSGILSITAAKSFSVRSVLAIDINPNAVEHVSSRKEQDRIQKLEVREGNLFSSVDKQMDGLFDTIIFNPPYLPQDYLNGKIIEDPALYGGKKGYEIVERFLEEVGDYLAPNGKILLLFSNLTRKDVVDRLIDYNLYSFEELAAENCGMMETLYVYLISAHSTRESIVSHGVKELSYLAKGSRGFVLKGRFDKASLVKKHLAKSHVVDVAVKVRNAQSDAPGTLLKEAKWLKELNKVGIGPRLYYSHEQFLLLELVEGISLDKYLETISGGATSHEGRLVLLEVLRQCRQMDLLKVSKEEMHRPYSNVLVTGSSHVVLLDAEKSKISGTHKTPNVVLLDFERCHRNDAPQNVTQFVTFLIKSNLLSLEDGRELAQEYKQNYSEEIYQVILKKVIGD